MKFEIRNPKTVDKFVMHLHHKLVHGFRFRILTAIDCI